MPNLATIQHFSADQVALIKQTIMAGKSTPTDNDLALFGMICQRSGLDPFAKQIYAIERKGKWTFQISIDGLRAIADRTGQYAGSDEPLYDEGLDLFAFEQSGRKLPTICKVTVWKMVGGQRCPFVGIAKYSEFLQSYDGKPSGLWATMPLNMLAVRAESQALRKAFPQCNSVASAVDAEAIQPAEDDDWRVSGYNWAVSQGLDPNVAANIVNQAVSKEHLFKAIKQVLPKASVVEAEVVAAEDF
jgi:phage recombination protein Bet